MGNSSAASILPEILEPFRRQLGIAHRVLDVLVAEVVLQRARIDALVRSLKPPACRSMRGWIGNGILAAAPRRWISFLKPSGVIGAPRSQERRRTCGGAGVP